MLNKVKQFLYPYERLISMCCGIVCAFIISRLAGFIDWAWWWLISPLWIPLLLGMLIFIFAYLRAIVKHFFRKL